MCAGVDSIKPLVSRLDAAGVNYTMSKSGRPAVFFRDPGVRDMSDHDPGVNEGHE